VSRTERIRPTGAAVIGAMIGAVALAGCGAGQVTQTSTQITAPGGMQAGVGMIAVRDAKIEFGEAIEGGDVYERGGDAPLQMRIANTGLEADRLVSATSPVASGVEISGNREVPGGQVLLVDGDAPTATAQPASDGEPGAQHEAHIVLTGLREDVLAGLTYPVVLTFARAGEVRMNVPVANPSVPREDAHAAEHAGKHAE
jgi:copper(I)-binding protein